MSGTEFPSIVQVEPTNYCNLTCPRCPMRTMTYPRGVMDSEVFTAIINECAEHHVLVKLFYLGEPLLHPDLDAMLMYANQKKVPVALTTNGSLLTGRQIEILLRYVSTFAISVDGTDAQSYEQIRQGGNYAQLRKTVQKICNLNRSYNIHFVLTTILPDEGYNSYLTNFIAEWKKMDVKITALQLQHHEKGWTASKRQYVCPDGLQGLIIRWDGNITYCCGDVNTETVLGTVPKDTITAVWNSRKLLDIHTAIKEEKYDSYACKNCRVYYHRFKNKPLQVSKEEYDMLSDGMKAGMQKRS